MLGSVPKSRAALSTRVVVDGRAVHFEGADAYEEADRLSEVQCCFQVQNDSAPYIGWVSISRFSNTFSISL
jgi:hypothetical protein